MASSDRDRLRVASLNMLGGPPEGEEPPAGVIIAGLTRATDADDSSFKDARAYSDLSEASILINPRVSSSDRDGLGGGGLLLDYIHGGEDGHVA